LIIETLRTLKEEEINMKRLFVLLSVIAVAVVFSTGCASTVSTVTASGAAQLKAEPMSLWARPLEVGFTVVGMGEGKAQNLQVEGSLSSNKVVDSAPSFFIGGISDVKISPMVKLAAFNAIQEAKADGIYITMAKEETDGSLKKAWVRGLLLKIGIYGPVTLERADAARMCKCGGAKKGCALKSETVVPRIEAALKPEDQ